MPEKGQNLNIENNIFEGFNNEIEKKGSDFIKSMKKAEVNEQINIFNNKSKDILDAINKNIKDNFYKIDKTTLQIYIKAQKAFEEDYEILGINKNNNNNDIKSLITEMKNRIDLKKIDTETFTEEQLNSLKAFATEKNNRTTYMNVPIGTLDKVIAEIDKKIESIKKDKENIAQTGSNINKTPETSVNIIETDKKYRNAMFDNLLGKENQHTIDITKTQNDKNSDKYKFVERLMKYNGIKEIKEISNVQIIKASNNDERYKAGTKYILFERKIQLSNEPFNYSGREFKKENEKIYELDKNGKARNEIKENKIMKNFTLDKNGIITIKIENTEGTQDDMQKLRRDKAMEDKGFPMKIGDKNIDRESNISGINLFDDRGNYRLFETYLEKESVDEVLKNSSSILKQIEEYAPAPGTSDANDDTNFHNEYANILNRYILTINNKPGSQSAKEGMITVYLSFLTPENLNLLGGDQTTRINNYNKLIPIFSKLPESGKRKIIELGIAIKAQEKLSPTKMIGKGFDKLVEQFGPMLLSILKFFGIGKTSLLKMFPNAEKKINELFAKEYKLSDEQKTAIETISAKIKAEDKEDIPSRKEKEDKPTAKEIKERFKERKNTYIKQFTEGNSKNVQYLNPAQLKTGIKLYNKKSNTTIVINDIVKFDSKNQIESIKDYDKFTEVLETILDNDDTWTNIIQAKNEMQKNVIKKDVPQPYSENNIKVESLEGYQYRIWNIEDVTRYLTASLFTDKDLSYTMTENDLKSNDPTRFTVKDTQEKKINTTAEKEKTEFDTLLTQLSTNIGKFREGDDKTDENNEFSSTYKTTILDPLEKIFTVKSADTNGKSYYELLIERLKTDEKDETVQKIFKNPIHLANLIIKNSSEGENDSRKRSINQYNSPYNNKDIIDIAKNPNLIFGAELSKDDKIILNGRQQSNKKGLITFVITPKIQESICVRYADVKKTSKKPV